MCLSEAEGEKMMNYALPFCILILTFRICSQQADGTQNIVSATIYSTRIETTYHKDSKASGAIFIFVTSDITNGYVEWKQSVHLTLSKIASLNYMIPFNLCICPTRRTSVFVYELLGDGIIQNGVSNPVLEFRNRTFYSDVAGCNISDFQPSYSHLEECSIISTCVPITVHCSYSQNSMATGFQVIAQLSNASTVEQIHVQSTTVCPNLLIIPLAENETYQITIFAIRGESGILNSVGEYSASVTTLCGTTSTEQGSIPDKILSMGDASLMITSSLSAATAFAFVIVVGVSFFCYFYKVTFYFKDDIQS